MSRKSHVLTLLAAGAAFALAFVAYPPPETARAQDVIDAGVSAAPAADVAPPAVIVTPAPAAPSLSQALAKAQAALPLWLQVLTAVIALASALANVVSPASKLGKVLHSIALNGPRLQQAVVQLEGKAPIQLPSSQS